MTFAEKRQDLYTPLQTSHEGIGLKCENLQPYGSYKIRGIEFLLSHLPMRRLAEGLVTVSAGNMARALAGETVKRGLKVKAFIPDTTPEIKKQALHELKCDVEERPFSEIWQMVMSMRVPASGYYVHPLDPLLRQGYGRMAAEILAQAPTVEAVVAPYGCGGLFLGLAEAFEKIKPSVKLYAAEADHAAPLSAALSAGEIVKVERQAGFIDAIGTPSVLPQAYMLVRRLCADSLVVSQEEARRALHDLFVENDLMVEGAAAVAYAAARKLTGYKTGRVVTVLSGGNIDREVFRRLVKV